MSLTPGTRIGVYEITAQIGAGGMGEVYRATDTKLKRQVAIKVLPPSLAADRDRLARFQREAEVLASVNHPNIAAIYGLEESAGIIALVMELVEGDEILVGDAAGDAQTPARGRRGSRRGAGVGTVCGLDLPTRSVAVRGEPYVAALLVPSAARVEPADQVVTQIPHRQRAIRALFVDLHDRRREIRRRLAEVDGAEPADDDVGLRRHTRIGREEQPSGSGLLEIAQRGQYQRRR